MIPSWEAPSTLITPGPTLNFMTGGASDDFYLDPLECDYTIDTRLETQDAPRSAGVIKFPTLLGAGHLKLVGRLKPVTDTAAARDSMARSMRAAALALSGGIATGTYVCSEGSLEVQLEMWPSIRGGFRKTFVLVLIAADPMFS